MRRIFAQWYSYGALLVAGSIIDVACRLFPSELPFWMPWEFSWPVYLAITLTLVWYGRGWFKLAADQRPALWRSICFGIGVLSIYSVLQTHVDYLAQHMFFIHRAAHFVLLYPAPMLIALSAPGKVVRAGTPGYLNPLIEAPVVRRGFDLMRRPVIAPLLFVGLIYFWLIPQIHTRAMLDSNFHDAMDWSIAIGAIVFWSLMLGQWPRPPAAISFQARLVVILLVLLPQVALGAVLVWSAADVYPIYAICGRIFAMTALDDQHYGGLIIALPSTVMCIVAMCLVLTARRRSRMPDVVLRNSA
jgi:putative membrane protein